MRQRPLLLGITFALLLSVAFVVATSLKWIPPMTESVIVQVIATVGLVVIAVITSSAAQRKDTKRAADAAESAAADAAIARDHLANNHDTNLREEGDERHIAVMNGQRRLEEGLHTLTQVVSGVLQDNITSRQHGAHQDERLGRLEKIVLAVGNTVPVPTVDEQITELENTLNRRAKEKEKEANA